jgi:predicted nucleic acid-binding protein
MSLTGIRLSEAQTRLEALAHLGMQLVPPTLELDYLALRWAARLGHTVAYDAHYLALAELLGCDFWTADRPLAAAARVQVPWVHTIDQIK